MRLADPIQQLTGVGEKNAKNLHKLGIFSIRDLVFHFPWRYDDLSVVTPIQQVKAGGTYVIQASVETAAARRSFRKGITILEVLVSDGTGSLMTTWFNQPYLQSVFQKGRKFLFAGAVTFYDCLQMQNPQWEPVSARPLHVGRIVPVYNLTRGVFPKWLRSLLKRALDALPPLPEHLPPTLLRRYRLLDFDHALRSIHFPSTRARAGQAKRRLAFEELLIHELKVLLNKQRLRRLKAAPIPFDQHLTADFIKRLPFTLTASQKQAAWAILQDLQNNHPANRLLSGDVGSGKTIVAAIAALQAVKSGLLVAIMAPTEILAQQHFATLGALPYFDSYPIGLLCGNKKMIRANGKQHQTSKAEFLKALRHDKIRIVIGTHALLQNSVPWKNLGLVIVDEQHRFGVQQRAFLQQQSGNDIFPHFLSTTATPIPRTLALSLYGDLDVCRIKQLPSGRKKIITEIIQPRQRQDMYRRVERLLKVGQQAFVICPLIDPSDTLGVKSATEECERLRQEIFPKLRLGLLHGKLSAQEKETIVRQFADRTLDVLVSTTVVEVGVDFPNATAMIIEGAERFGLSQLHQLRGRVGRADLQSYCFLVPSTELAEQAAKRLAAIVEHHDGLRLAEIDLQLRGPGQTYGYEQSGYAQFKIADLFDAPTLEQAREAAADILASPDLDRYPLLAKKIKALEQDLHLE